jgi:hypothetical protein
VPDTVLEADTGHRGTDGNSYLYGTATGKQIAELKGEFSGFFLNGRLIY